MVTTSTSSTTARSVVTICRSWPKLGAARIASAALCTRVWLARLPRQTASRLRYSALSRATSWRCRSIEETLEIDNAVADIAARRAQQPQRLGMLVEEIGVPAQIGDHLAAADLARLRPRRRRAALAWS